MDSKKKTPEEINAAVYAMQKLQNEMQGEAEKAGIRTEQDVVALVKSVRDGE